VPDAKTLWLFREQLTRAGAIERLFPSFDAVLRRAGYFAMAGQIVDATVVEARRPRLTKDEKATVKGGWCPGRGRKRSARRADGYRRSLGPQARAPPPGKGRSSRPTRPSS
jgi:hypothetical protein